MKNNDYTVIFDLRAWKVWTIVSFNVSAIFKKTSLSILRFNWFLYNDSVCYICLFAGQMNLKYSVSQF